ncbi:MAG: lipocalin family protein [Paracoccaceae bacterium]|nr:lipocalin family protein [Paracoccaceae bacterium]
MRALSLALVLAGCTAAAPYRDAAVPMTSIASLDVGRYAGRWSEVARVGEPLVPGCGPVSLTQAADVRGGFALSGLCHAGGPMGPDRLVRGQARAAGPGRFDLAVEGGYSGPIWVLWVDEGYRTAVVGMPSGRAGWILNRDPEIPPDRLRAAREVLAWNGYDLSQLRMVRE